MTVKGWCGYDWEKQKPKTKKHPPKKLQSRQTGPDYLLTRGCTEQNVHKYIKYDNRRTLTALLWQPGCTANWMYYCLHSAITQVTAYNLSKTNTTTPKHIISYCQRLHSHTLQSSQIHQWFLSQNHVSTGRISTVNYDNKSLGTHTR